MSWLNALTLSLSAWVTSKSYDFSPLQDAASTTSSAAPPVSTICGDIITVANQDLANNWLWTAGEVYQCLLSVPFNDAVALRYIDYYNTTIQFQSTLSYLKNPPFGYQQPAIDVQQKLAQIYQNITTGKYKNEYDFEATLWTLVQQMHDGHVTLFSGALSAFSFGSPYDIMSVSMDGKQAPKVYIKDDVIDSVAQGWTPSAIKTINGEDAVSYLKRFAQVQSTGMLEPNADWNQLMYSPVQDILGTFNTFGWNAVLYPGDNLTFTFENNTNPIETIWLAYYLNTEQTGPLTTGGDFYNYFVLGFLPESYVANSSDTSNSTLGTGIVPVLKSWADLNTTTAYPNNPDIVQPGLSIGGAGGIITGYFLKDISTAVISIPNFDEYGTSAQAFSNTTALFIQRAKAAGMTKVVIDLQGNYGGDVILAFDTFQQFFPSTEPFAASRRRSHKNDNILGGAITDFWDRLSPSNKTFPFDVYYPQMAANEWVVTDRLNAATGRNFTSWPQYHGPVPHNGDQFSLVERYNLSSTIFDMDASDGFIPTQRSTRSPPWASQDIVILTDAACGSTCSLFVEMMTYNAGVRTVVVGGQPSTGPMQAASGGRGARGFTADLLDENLQFAGQVNRTANTTLPQVREQAIFTFDMGFNLRDQVRKNDDVPLQFRYVAANCRIYYTFANANNMTRLWHDAAAAIWTNPSLCVQGSTGYATTGNSTSASNPPTGDIKTQDISHAQTNVKVQFPISLGPGLSDGAGPPRAAGTFGPCDSRCTAQTCTFISCDGGGTVQLCPFTCNKPGQFCGVGNKGVCEAATQTESKLLTVNGGSKQTSKGFFNGICQPLSSQLQYLCPNSGDSGIAPPP